MVASAVAAPGRGRVRVRAGGRARQGAAANGDSARAATARCGASHGQRRPPRLNRGPSRFDSPLPRFLSHHLILSLGGCACRPPSPLVSTCAGGRACFRPQPRPSLSLWERMPPASARLFGVTVSVFMLTEPICLAPSATNRCMSPDLVDKCQCLVIPVRPSMCSLGGGHRVPGGSTLELAVFQL